MDSYNDMELVRLSVGGDARAFEHLVRRHYMTVYRISYRWCGVKEDAEDITQDVFVKLARKLRTFGQKSSFKTWLYRIAINTAKDFLRKYAIKNAYESTWAFQQGSKNPEPPEDDHLDAAKLYSELGKLPEKQKTAILLVFGEGLSHREASRVLNCPETTISWRIFQARKKLKRSLSQKI